MKTRAKLLATALFAAVSLSAPVAADARRYVVIEEAPPSPLAERIPAARRGYTWAPGYWNWNGRRHVWVGGHFIRARGDGYRWAPHRWDYREGGYRFAPGRWERGPDRKEHGQ